MKPSITRTAGRAAVWQLLGGGWTTVVRLGASAILARQLTPTDFGIFGLALLVYEFITYGAAVGMSSGIIAKKNVTDEDLCTCFWTMAVVRFLMFVVCYLSAPAAASFFNNELVADVLRVISFTFLISIIESVSLTLLSKELRYKTINKIRAILVLVESAIAIYLAVFKGLGYWALVISMMISTTITSTAFFIAAKWVPKFKFSMESFNYLFKFGVNNLGFSIVNYLNQNLDYLLVGKVLGARSLGLYEFAYRVPHLIQQRVVQPIGNVVFPSLSKVKDDDEMLINGYLKSIKFLCLIAFPMISGLAIVAEQMVTVLWGTQWREIIEPLRVLCICALLRVAPQSSGAVLLCKERPDLPFKVSLAGLLFTIPCVGVLGYFFGIIGVAWGMVLSSLPSYLAVYYAFKLTNQPIIKLFSALSPICFASLVCFICASIIQSIMTSIVPNYINLLITILVGGLSYILCLFRLFPQYTHNLIYSIEEILNKSIIGKVHWLFPAKPSEFKK